MAEKNQRLTGAASPYGHKPHPSAARLPCQCCKVLTGVTSRWGPAKGAKPDRRVGSKSRDAAVPSKLCNLTWNPKKGHPEREREGERERVLSNMARFEHVSKPARIIQERGAEIEQQHRYQVTNPELVHKKRSNTDEK